MRDYVILIVLLNYFVSGKLEKSQSSFGVRSFYDEGNPRRLRENNDFERERNDVMTSRLRVSRFS